MKGDGSRENHPFGGFSLERTIKQDGRYLLYYTWPESDGESGDEADGDTRAAVRGEPASDPVGADREVSPGAGPRAGAGGGARV